MDVINKVVSTVADFYGNININPATLSGAIDIIVVEQESGELTCSPFHVKFGKLKLLRPFEKKVTITINGEPTDLTMKVGEAGGAFFVVKTGLPVPSEYVTSPLAHGSVLNEEVEPLSLGEVTIQVDDVQQGETGGDAYHLPRRPRQRSLSEQYPDMIPAGTKFKDLDQLSDAGLDRRTDAQRKPPETASTSFPGPASPPNGWLWTWGGLPVKAGDSSQPQKEDTWEKESSKSLALTNAAVNGSSSSSSLAVTFEKKPVVSSLTMALQQNDIKVENDSSEMSTKEKVDSFFASLPAEDVVKTESSTSGAAVSVVPTVVLQDTLSATAEDDTYPSKDLSLPTDDASGTCHTPFPNPLHPITSLEFSLCGRSNLQTLQKANSAPLIGITNTSSGPLELVTPKPTELAAALEAFECHKITFEAFQANPNTLSDPAVVVRVNCISYFDWQVASSVLIASVAFGKDLSNEAMTRLLSQSAAASSTAPYTTSGEAKRYSSFGNLRYWWSRTENRSTSPGPVSSSPDQAARNAVASELTGSVAAGATAAMNTATAWGSPVRSDNLPIRESPEKSVTESAAASPNKQTSYVKSLRLTSDELKTLKLKKGINNVTFSVTSTLQGTATCSAKIFFWDYKTKVVISDVDGTITKSDVWGHVYTMVGRDWTHAGVASLYTNIRRNGYQILYLTSRAIGQSNYTRDYLNKVEQESNKLPDGPVIMSPDRLFAAFHREVIQRRPEEFKIACLRDIKRLWGPGIAPFYAGFGNRITDALSYRSVEIPPSRIFTIDPTGEIRLDLISSYKSSYIKMNDIVDHIFPAFDPSSPPDHMIESFGDLEFWKSVITDDVDITPEELAAGKPASADFGSKLVPSSNGESEEDEEYDDEYDDDELEDDDDEEEDEDEGEEDEEDDAGISELAKHVQEVGMQPF